MRKKRATYYGIGVCLAKIVNAILRGKNSLLMVGTYLHGEYQNSDLYISVPCVVGSSGVEEIVQWKLSDIEQIGFNKSCEQLKEVFKTAKLAIK